MSPKQEKQQIFVLGLDDFNRRQLEALPGSEQYDFHEALPTERLKAYTGQHIDSVLKEARETLKAHKVDALITWWDFPCTLLLGKLNDDLGFEGLTLEHALRCEHKFWSRRLQAAVIPEAVPEFDVVDPFDAEAFEDLKLSTPFWLKPIKATESMLSFRIESAEDYERALEKTRESIRELARPVNEILAHANLPEDIAHVDGSHCQLETECGGSQHTVCGYVAHGEIQIYGVVDSLNYPDTTSFLCYAYPSELPQFIQSRMIDLSRKVIRHLGLRQNAFNIEYFYNEQKDAIKLLEINPRISQSHSNIFHKVDGKSDESLIIELALGEDAGFPRGQGEYNCAAKYYLRTFEDGRVERIPTRGETEALQEAFPGLLVHIEVEEGQRLSNIVEHDSNSFVLAICFLGGEDREQLHEKFKAVSERLDFDIQRD